MYPDLKGKVAIVTGASRKAGIGASMAQHLAQQGVNIITTYFRPYDKEIGLEKDASEAEILIHELREMGVQAYGIELDLSDPKTPATLFDFALTKFDAVDILVNNATYSTQVNIHQLTAENIDKHYGVNMRGMMLLCAEFVKRWNEKNGGRIINMSSGQSYSAMPNELPYIATKGAVEAFTLSASAEIAPLGITMNAIDPGITDTGWIPDDLKQTWIQNAPFGRIGQPYDVARLVCFLASEQAQWITGQLIRSRGSM